MVRTAVAAAASVACLAAVLPGPAGAIGTDTLGGLVTATATGQPLAGVCVELIDLAEESTAGPIVVVTDSVGRWEATALDATDFIVAFNLCEQPLAGVAYEFWEDTRDPLDEDVVTLGPGQQRTDINAALDPAGTISGTVTETGTGVLLEGICVSANDANTGWFGFAITDAQGHYAMVNLPETAYQLVFSDCSAPFHSVAIVLPDPVVVTAGGTQGADVTLDQGGALTGTVTTTHTGAPISFVCVTVVSENSTDPEGDSRITFTGDSPDGFDPDSGDFLFPGLPAGAYVLTFNSDLCGQDDLDTTQVEVIIQNGQTEDVDGQVHPRPSIEAACPQDVPEDGFPDVPASNVHERAVDCLTSFGIVRGQANGTYGPALNVRRDQMASFVARTLANAGVVLPTSPPDAFTDDEGNTHELAIDQLAALGIVGGTGEGRYSPAGLVSRGQMAAFLVGAYEQATSAILLRGADAFTDDQGTTHEVSIDKAANAGFTAGNTDGTFGPGSPVRRDQMATFLARLLDRVLRDSDFAEQGGE